MSPNQPLPSSDRTVEIEPDREPVPLENDRNPIRSAWDVLDAYAGTLDMPSDWGIEHDHYLYGTPKRYSSDDL